MDINELAEKLLVEKLAVDLEEAKGEANIDGHGDEGEGYDFEVMARSILAKYSIEPLPERD